MRKKIFVHVGLHKTGSTSIQCFLTYQRERLGKHGFIYPESGVPLLFPYGHHLLAWSCLQRSEYRPEFPDDTFSSDEEFDVAWNNFHEEIKKYNISNVIISSEEFDVYSASEIGEFSRHLPEYDIIPIIYLRNYCDFIESGYKTSVLYSRYPDSIVEYAANQRTRLDYSQMVADWAEVSPAGQAVVVNYDNPEIRNNVISSFLSILELDKALFDGDSTRFDNVSAPAVTAYLVHFMRQSGLAEESIATWLDIVLKVKSSSNEYSILPENLFEELDEKYRLELEKLRNNFQLGRVRAKGWDRIEPPRRRKFLNGVPEAIVANTLDIVSRSKG